MAVSFFLYNLYYQLYYLEMFSNVCREHNANTTEYFHPAHQHLKYDELETSQHQDSRLGVLYTGVLFILTSEQSIINLETVYHQNGNIKDLAVH